MSKRDHVSIVIQRKVNGAVWEPLEDESARAVEIGVPWRGAVPIRVTVRSNSSVN
jgi:hypothetical protein